MEVKRLIFYLLKKLILLWWWCLGWKINGRFPHEVKKMVIIIGPHTSAWDVFVGVSALEIEKITHVHFFGKKELFEGPFAYYFKALGGIPVDRFHPHGMVGQVVDAMNKAEYFRFGISPEGTRNIVDRLRTGFYHIAVQAKVPILMIGFDFAHREVVVGDLLYPSGNIDTDMKTIVSFFAPIQGKNPEKGMGHMKS